MDGSIVLRCLAALSFSRITQTFPACGSNLLLSDLVEKGKLIRLENGAYSLPTSEGW
jgi:hypothetical protein